jgi:hypothetical protein
VYVYLTNVQAGLQVSVFTVNAGAMVISPAVAPAAQQWTRVSVVTGGGGAANSWTSFGVTMSGLVPNTAVIIDDFSWN